MASISESAPIQRRPSSGGRAGRVAVNAFFYVLMTALAFVFMAPLGWSAPVFLVGIIPMFVGVALLAYAYLFDRLE